MNIRVFLPILLATLILSTVPAFAVPASPAPGAPATHEPATDASSPEAAAPRENPLPPSPAEPTPEELALQQALAEKQAKIREANSLRDVLLTELEILTENYNRIRSELNATEQRLQQNRLRLREAIEAFRARSDIYQNRISHLYRHGESSFIEVLLNTKDFRDFVVRVSFLVRVGQNDLELVDSLLAEKEQIEETESQLSTLRDGQLVSERQLQAKQIEVGNKIAEYSAFLAGLENDIRVLVEVDAERRAEEQGQLLARLKGEAAESGSPLASMLDKSSVIGTTLQYLGIPYLWGGERPDTGFDCSGLVLYVFRQHGVRVPHYSGWQFQMGTPVSKDALIPGDLVFFGSPIHHVGIFMGGDYFINAPRTGDVVKISKLSPRDDFAGARRFPLKPKRTEIPTQTILPVF